MTDATRRPPDPQDRDGFSPGSTVDRYEVKELLGRGGMGEVWLAWDPTLRRKVALKRVGRHLDFDKQNRVQILKEARRASKVSDPRIAAVHDVVEYGGEVVLVMEYVEGDSMRRRMTGPMSPGQFWDIAQECVKAIEIAHREGLIHRDIKPDNIMITRSGQVKILDFGIAGRIVHAEDTTTVMSGAGDSGIAGTPAYMSPEALRGRPLDGRTDIFSLGVFFYEALAGRRPFLGATRNAVVGQILHEEPVPLHEVDPGISLPLSAVVGRMLAKDPDRRFQTAGELLDALMAAHRGEGVVTTVRVPGSGETGSPAVRMRFVWLFAVVLPAAIFVAAKGPQAISDRLGLTPLPGNRDVAVLPVTVEENDQDRSALAMGLTWVVTEGLTGLSVRPPLQVAAFKDMVEGSVTTPAAAREFLGTPLALAARLRASEKTYRVDLRLVQAGSGRTLRRARAHAPVTNPGELVRRCYVAAAGLLEVPGEVLPADVDGFTAAGAGTERFYLQGLGKLSAAETVDGDDGIHRVKEAMADLDLASRSDPNFAPVWAALSQAHLRMLDLTQDARWTASARELAENAVKLGPGLAAAHRALGLALAKAKQTDEAFGQFQEAVELDPTDDVSLYERGRSFGRRGLMDREAELFQAAVEARPHYWRPYWWLGMNYYRRGEFEKAIDPFRKLIEHAPDLYRGYSLLGAMHLLRGEYSEAVDLLEQSIALHPTGASLSNLATAYFSKRDFEKTIQTYNKALGSEFVNYRVWMNLGDAYFWAPGKREEARGAYEQALQLGKKERAERPYDATIDADLAMIHANLGDVDSARVYLASALDGGASDPMVQYSAALVSWQLGEKEAAFSHLEQAVDGGFSVKSVRDWAVFDAWRDDPRYAAAVGDSTGAPE